MKTVIKCFSIIFALTGMLEAATIYVDANVPGGVQSGVNWDNAYVTLIQALAVASSGDDIWLAQGTYYPTDNPADRDATFVVATSNLSVYGGFTNGMVGLAERDWAAYPTVLSGNIQQDADPANNSRRVLYINAHGVRVDGCTISDGYGDDTVDGVGIYNFRANEMIMANCLVVSNRAGNSGAGIYNRSGSMMIVSNCEFRANSGDFIGGGVSISDTDNYGIFNTITDCVFINNTGPLVGGGLANYQSGSTAVVTRCVFSGNQALTTGGGLQSGNLASTRVYDCIFSGNYGAGGGGAVYVSGNSNEFVRCVFSGNRSTNNTGGAMMTRSHATVDNVCRMAQCVFVGNSAQVSGGALALASTNYIENCTFYKSLSTGSGWGGAIFAQANLDRLHVRNSIFRANRNTSERGNEMWLVADSRDVEISYTLISTNAADFESNGADVTFGPGHMTNDPLFPAIGSGTWTSVMAENLLTGECTLTDSAQSWLANEHAGRFVYVTNAHHAAYYIVSNTPTTLTVWASAATLAGAIGDNYEILDVHPVSRAGRWTPSGWVTDAECSPCVDAGDPASDFADELRPNGRRVNIGAYGNTWQASKTLIPAGTLFKFW